MSRTVLANCGLKDLLWLSLCGGSPVQSYISILREVRDPRDINARHPVETILFLTLAATLCGAKSCVEVAEFTEGRESELCEIVDLPYGAPSHDTFSRLFRLLDPAELAKAFTAFMTALRAELGLGPTQGVVAIDGKSLRRGYEKGRSHMPPLMVSVWDSQTRVAIAQARAPGGNEIAATLKLLGSLVLKACTVTADALHCHPAMAQAVLDAKADYALGLKANHGPLYAEAERAFAKAGADAPSLPPKRRRMAASSGAAPACWRRDRGTCAVAGSQGAGSYRSGTHRNERRERDRHPGGGKDYGPENLAVIRRLARTSCECTLPISISRKMRRAMWSKEFFFELFAHMR